MNQLGSDTGTKLEDLYNTKALVKDGCLLGSLCRKTDNEQEVLRDVSSDSSAVCQLESLEKFQ